MRTRGFHGLGAVDPATAMAMAIATYPIPPNPGGGDSDWPEYAAAQERNRQLLYDQLTAGYAAPNAVATQATPTLAQPVTLPLATSPAATLTTQIAPDGSLVTVASPTLTDLDVQSAQFPTFIAAQGDPNQARPGAGIWPLALGALALFSMS